MPLSHHEVIEHNRYAWNWAAQNGNRWSQPVSTHEIAKARSKNIQLKLTPNKYLPCNWLQDLENRHILGLASGGGQQGPLLAAAGANVTIFDISLDQLKVDRNCSEQHGLSIQTVLGNAADLSAFASKSFDMIINPVSNCFFPELNVVWDECARVLKKSGILIYSFMNPISYLFDFEEANGGQFRLKYHSPYSDHGSLTYEEKTRFLYPEAPLEFGHSLSDQIGLLVRKGFVLEDMFEDNWGDPNGLDKFFPSFIAVKARRI